MCKLRLLFFSVLFLFIPAVAQQSASPTFSIASANQTGVPTGGTFDGTLENVNLQNGNVSVTIPLLHLPGVAGHDLNLNWHVDSKYYGMTGGSPPTYAPDTGGTNYTPPSFRPVRSTIFNRFGGGFLNIPVLESYTITLPWDTYDGMGAVTHLRPYCTTGYVFYDLTGAAHSFNNLAHCGGAAHPNNPEVNIDESNDGSFYRLDTSSSSEDVVYDQSGIQYHFGPTSTRVIDPSGNTITYSISGLGTSNLTYTITDTLNHVVTVATAPITTSNPVGSFSITYSDSQGTQRKITATSTNLSNSDETSSLSIQGGRCSDGGGQSNVYIGTYTSNARSQDTITFPTGESYVVTYSGFHEVSKVQYPSGGYTAYKYQSIPGGYSDANWTIWGDIREVLSKSICANASGSCSSQDLQTTTYAPSTVLPSTVINGTGNTLVEFTDPAGDVTHVEFSPDGVGAPGVEKKRLLYSGNKISLLRTIQKQYVGGNPTVCAPNPTVVTTTLNDVSPNLTSRIELDYQTIGLNDSSAAQDICGSSAQSSNVVAMREYGFDGALVRTTTNTWSASTTAAPHILDRKTNTTVTGTGVQSTHDWIFTSTGLLQQETVAGTNATSGTIIYGHDTQGRLTSVQNALGTTTYSYTPAWTNTSSSCPVGPSASPTSVTDPLQHVSSASYDACTGTLHSQQDVNGRTTSFGYDARMRMTSQLNPDSGGLLIAYSSGSGTPITTNKAFDASHTSTNVVTHDGVGRPINSTDINSGVKIDWTYDSMGHLYTASNPYISTTESSYGLTTYLYDALGRKRSEARPQGTATWTITGNTTVYKDESGNRSTQVFDTFGNLTKLTEAIGAVTNYSYDPLGNLIRVGQNGVSGDTARVRTFTYDGLSRLVTARNVETGTICYGQWSGGSVGSGTCQNGYDALGNLRYKTDSSNGLVSYTYDALSRLLTKNIAGSSSCYFYDNAATTNGVGRLAAEWNQTGTCATTPSSIPAGSLLALRQITAYDVMGREKTYQTCVLSNCTGSMRSQALSYDLAGNLTQYGDGRSTVTFTQSIDTSNRLKSVTSSWSDATHPATLLNVTSFTGPGWKSESLGNGLSQCRDWDAGMRMNGMYVVPTGGSTSCSGTNIYSFTMKHSDGSSGYAPNSNLLWVNDLVNGTWTAGYDQVNRITSAGQSGSPYQTSTSFSNFCWRYDSFGNRLKQAHSSGPLDVNCNSTNGSPVGSVSQSYDAATNRMTSASGEVYQSGSASLTFNYDNKGRIQSDNWNYTYFWDNDGKLCAVGNTYTRSYTGYVYDAQGRRVGKGTIPYRSGIDFCNPRTNGFQLAAEFILGPSGDTLTELNGQGTWVHTDIALGGASAVYDPKGLHFEFSDWLGTRRVQTDFAGNREMVFTGGLFGDIITNTAIATGAADATEKHFTGKERDQESGLDYFGARYYASNIGRFMSPDWSAKVEPIPYSKLDNPQSLNLYAYVGNNPLSNLDVDGHDLLANLHFMLNQGGVPQAEALMEAVQLERQESQRKTQQQMTTSAAGVAFIKGWEGWNGTVDKKTGLTYAKDDGFGNGTIGWGHNCGKCADFAGGITKAQGDALLSKDLGSFEGAVNGLGANLSQQQFDGLVSFAFNVRSSGGSTLFSNVASGANVTEGNFTAYGHARVNGQLVVVPSLMRRRESEYNVYANGVYDSSH